MVESTPSAAARPLLPELWALLAASRPAFRQERTHQRSVALVLGWLSAFGRHTVTGVLLVLGMGAVDWTAWHRLFSRGRIDYDQLTTCVLGQTLDLSAPTDPYLVGVDATQIARHSRTMPGTTWLRHLGTAIFRPGLHRAQRFVHLAWLPLPSPTGYSRAVPLRFVPAFPPRRSPCRITRREKNGKREWRRCGGGGWPWMGRDGPRSGSSLSATAPTAPRRCGRRCRTGSRCWPAARRTGRCLPCRRLPLPAPRAGPAAMASGSPAPTPSWRCAAAGGGSP
ncbi:MAG: transposase [Thermomicrobiales bacterium]